MKKLLILGGSRYVIPAIEAAHNLGVYVVTADYLPDNAGHKYADEYHNVSIIDKDAVLNLAKELNIDGVLSFATDPGVVVQGYVTEKLGLPGFPYQSGVILQNKDLFRNFLKENGFNVPLAMGFKNKEDVYTELNKFRWPIIVKPVDSAGSKGVTRVDHLAELDIAIDHAIECGHNGRFIIEEFIEQDGCSSDTDCFSIDNELVFASFDCQYFDTNAANAFTPSAYSWPSNMPKQAQEELRSELARLIKLLNMGTSLFNVESRVGKDGKAYLMEVSPRAGGNRLSEMLKLACGQDLIMSSVKGALGMPVESLHDPVYDGIWAEYIIHSYESGKFVELWIDNEFEQKYIVQKDLWVKPGDTVRTFTGANETIGTLVMRFDNRGDAETMLEKHDNWLKVIVEK